MADSDTMSGRRLTINSGTSQSVLVFLSNENQHLVNKMPSNQQTAWTLDAPLFHCAIRLENLLQSSTNIAHTASARNPNSNSPRFTVDSLSDFTFRLFALLADPQSRQIIEWDDTGTTIIAHDVREIKWDALLQRHLGRESSKITLHNSLIQRESRNLRDFKNHWNCYW